MCHCLRDCKYYYTGNFYKGLIELVLCAKIHSCHCLRDCKYYHTGNFYKGLIELMLYGKILTLVLKGK